MKSMRSLRTSRSARKTHGSRRKEQESSAEVQKKPAFSTGVTNAVRSRIATQHCHTPYPYMHIHAERA